MCKSSAFNLSAAESSPPPGAAPRALGICSDDIDDLERMPGQQLLDSGFIDITAAPFSADPSGQRDSTKAIQEAVIFGRHHKLAVYVPLGEYLVSDTIRCRGGWSDERFADHRYLPFSEVWPCVLIGERRDGRRPVVRLAPDSAGFADRNAVKCVFHFQCRDYRRTAPMAPLTDLENNNNTAFNQTFYGIDVEIGAGNPGAAAIHFGVAEGSTVQDCELRIGDGFAGIRGGPGNGTGLFNVRFSGGAVGLAADEYASIMSTVTVVGCRFEAQREAAVVYSQRGPLCLVGCAFTMLTGVPALRTAQNTIGTGINGANLVDCRIEYPDGAAGSQPTKATVVVRAATPIYVRNSWVRNASLLATDEERGQGGFGQLEGHGWTRVEEFAFAFESESNTVPFPIYVDGEKQGNVLEKLDRQAGMPPPNLCSRHILWNWERYPAWNGKGVVNVREAPYHAAGDGVMDDTAALQRAINENEAIFLPKGAYRITATLRLHPRSKIVGVNAAYSMIVPSGSAFADVASPRPAIQTACAKKAETQIGFFSVFMPREDAPGASMLDWTCGGDSSVRCVFPLTGFNQNDLLPLHHGLRPWHNWRWDDNLLALSRAVGAVKHFIATPGRENGDTWEGAERYRDCIPNGPLVHVHGDGGGGFYAFNAADGRQHGPDCRRVLVEGTRGPLAIYSANMQFCQGDAEMEIRGSANVCVYGAKNEKYELVFWIRDSHQIAIYGLGSLGVPMAPHGKVLVENSHAVVLAGLFLDSMEGFLKKHPHFLDDGPRSIRGLTFKNPWWTEGPMVHVRLQEGRTYTNAVLDRPTLFKVK